ncbi:MAG: nicotinate-nucleotide adenylyltransferase [Alphaproteobacteria bacterium]|nr:nicotinate-nucleotide adenylyltransferase [Alphaproteobacteria bacterium]
MNRRFLKFPERRAEEPGRNRAPRRRVGLLGGSFNPAHQGHRKLSLLALHRLCLDQVWWLVSPQNPLKTAAEMSPFSERVATARRVASHPRIRVSDFERRAGTVFTVDTVRELTRRMPRFGFVWLMGADNLIQIPRWRRWQEIFARVAVIVFDRPGFTRRALTGTAARRFGRARVREPRAAGLVDCQPPAWAFLHGVHDPSSATALRAGQIPR